MFELMYYSNANKNTNAADILSILNTARDFNTKNNITGCLLFHNNDFIQLLEGEEEIILTLFAHIKKDKRHENVMLLAKGEKEGRGFNNWSMAFHQIGKEDTRNIERFLFIKNFLALSGLTPKSTEATKLFFHLAELLLKEQPDARLK